MNDPSEVPLDEVYERTDLYFRYPGYWQVEEFSSEEEQSATVLTEGTSFWMVSVIRNVEDLEQVLESAVAAFEDEYDDLDVYERQVDDHSGWLRQELEFQYQDLVSTVQLQVAQSPGGVMLVIYQGHDRELEEHRETFDAITATLRLF